MKRWTLSTTLLLGAALAATAQDAEKGPLPPPSWTAPAAGEEVWRREIVQVRGVEEKPALAMVMGGNPDGSLQVVTHAGTKAKVARGDLRIAKRVAPVTAESAVELGDTIEVNWNNAWYQGRVLARAEKGLRMHYVGWASSWDALVPWRNLRVEYRLAGVVKATRLPVGQKVHVFWNGEWFRAEVLGHEESGYKVHYTGWAASFDETVGLGRIRYEHAFLGNRPGAASKEPFGEPVGADAALEVGQQVAIAWSGEWFLGLVLAVREDGKVRVRFSGWGSAWDEDVSRPRLRAGFAVEKFEKKPPPRSS